MEKHDLHHEFPAMNEKIHELKLSNIHFKKLFDQYHEINKSIQINFFYLVTDINYITYQQLKCFRIINFLDLDLNHLDIFVQIKNIP